MRELGGISQAQAEAFARLPRTTREISAPYIDALSLHCLRDAIHKKQAHQSLARLRITRAAIETLERPFDDVDLPGVVAESWLEIVKVILLTVADGRLYREAVSLAERALEEAPGGDGEQAPRLLFGLAVLNIDPYTAARVTGNRELYDGDVHNWLWRFSDEHADELEGMPREAWVMPAPQEALKRAEDYLTKAAELCEGDLLVRILKALVQTWNFRAQMLNEQVDGVRVLATSRRALSVLDRAKHAQQWLSVIGIMSVYGESPPLDEVRQFFSASMEELQDRYAPVLLLDIVKLGARVLSNASPADAAGLLERARAFISEHGDDVYRTEIFLFELKLAVRLAGVDPEAAAAGPTRDAALQIRRSAANENWSAERLAARLLLLAQESSERNEEDVGLQVLDEAEAVAPEFFAKHDEAQRALRAGLSMGIAVNHYRKRDWARAVAGYADALRRFLALRLRSPARDCLERLDDLSKHGTPNSIAEIVLQIAPLTLEMYPQLGDNSVRLVQRLCDRAMLNIADTSGMEEIVNVLLQIAKGHRFAATLGQATGMSISSDSRAASLLANIESIPPADLGASRLDDEVLLAAYAAPETLYAGATPNEMRTNLEHAFDERVSTLLLQSRTGAEFEYLTCDDICSRLDERTVLVNVYVGASVEGFAAVYTMLFTREGAHAGVLLRPLQEPANGGDDVAAHPAAESVADLRRSLGEDPGVDAIASPRAQELLGTNGHWFLGAAADALPALRKAGKDHLCIVPHGPLHFLPYHLLGESGPLADDFVVTYLPNLRLLDRRAPEKARRTVLASIGVGDDMPQAIEEAREVAEVFHTKPARASRAQACVKLATARCVHISAHGRHNVSAPAFQSIHLAPTAGSDGQLFAYQITPLELNGLELLTLSACETALGRVDLADNLRGLPAAFFGAGARAVVGTLWPSEVNASRHFFVALYQALEQEQVLLDAFSTAQRSTREQFPQFRDWGPFYLMGEWRSGIFKNRTKRKKK
jgi:hypothetical protein